MTSHLPQVSGPLVPLEAGRALPGPQSTDLSAHQVQGTAWAGLALSLLPSLSALRRSACGAPRVHDPGCLPLYLALLQNRRSS